MENNHLKREHLSQILWSLNSVCLTQREREKQIGYSRQEEYTDRNKAIYVKPGIILLRDNDKFILKTKSNIENIAWSFWSLST